MPLECSRLKKEQTKDYKIRTETNVQTEFIIVKAEV